MAASPHTTRDLIQVSVPIPCQLTDLKVRATILASVKLKQLITLSVCLSVCLSVTQSVSQSVCQEGRQTGNHGLNNEFVNCCEIKLNFIFFRSEMHC